MSEQKTEPTNFLAEPSNAWTFIFKDTRVLQQEKEQVPEFAKLSWNEG